MALVQQLGDDVQGDIPGRAGDRDPGRLRHSLALVGQCGDDLVHVWIPFENPAGIAAREGSDVGLGSSRPEAPKHRRGEHEVADPVRACHEYA